MYQEAGLAKQTTQDRAPMQKVSIQKAETEIGKKEEFKNNAWAWKDGVRIAQAQLHIWHLWGKLRSTRVSTATSVVRHWTTVGQLPNGIAELVTAVTYMAAFASVFINKFFWASMPRGKVEVRGEQPAMDEDQVKGYFWENL